MARNYKEEWGKVRGQLIAHASDQNIGYKYDDTTKDDWDKAIKIFQDRLDNYFFKPILRLISIGKGQGEGFAIVTPLCAMIEMLKYFKEGWISSAEIYKGKIGKKFLAKIKDKEVFEAFMTEEEIFKSSFFPYCKNKDKDKSFYIKIRCGLIHEAQTRGKWVIRKYPFTSTKKRQSYRENIETFKSTWIGIKKEKEDKSNSMTDNLATTDCTQKNPKEGTIEVINNLIKELASPDCINENPKTGKIELYRTVLYFKLLQYTRGYSSNLQNEASSELRKNFARCMDHLFEINIDPNDLPDWWVEVS